MRKWFICTITLLLLLASYAPLAFAESSSTGTASAEQAPLSSTTYTAHLEYEIYGDEPLFIQELSPSVTISNVVYDPVSKMTKITGSTRDFDTSGLSIIPVNMMWYGIGERSVNIAVRLVSPSNSVLAENNATVSIMGIGSAYYANASADGNELQLVANPLALLDTTYTSSPSNFSVSVNGVTYSPEAVSYDASANKLRLTMPIKFKAWDYVNLNAGATAIKFQSGSFHPAVSNMPVFIHLDLNGDKETKINDIVAYLKAQSTSEINYYRVKQLLQMIHQVSNFTETPIIID